MSQAAGAWRRDVKFTRFHMRSPVTVVFSLLVALFLVGCATKPATQWWRVGTCLVLYDQTTEEKQLVAIGQGCDIKRDTITAQGAVK